MRQRGIRRWWLACALVVVVGGTVSTACGGTEVASRPAGDARALNVVTTISPITSIVENIGGSRIAVRGVVPEGANSHTFDLPPSAAALFAEADLIVGNGLQLEGPTLAVANAAKKAGTPILLLGDLAIVEDEYLYDFSFPKEQGRPNPHVWPDPLLALEYAALVRSELSRLDPGGSPEYAGNYERFEERVGQLDAAIKAAVATVPAKSRSLLTYHDSWAYFAKRYGMTVVGAVQPSDFSEPSAGEVARLIKQVRALGLPAIFGSEVFPSPVMSQIARETGARFVDQLRDDDLPGVPGDPRHSYLGLMVTNMEVMIAALGGDASAVSAVDPGPVFDGESAAEYPQ